MTTLTAVRTTGIYCRPGCGAPTPRPQNTTRFPLAAAAEAAGFRACHRCRPYRVPEQLTWDKPELVCRAVRMILDGALDETNEAELAARLGVSARHLRRLFAAHLGVTPDGLARSARVHFARRLLDDTDLSIAAIAAAAGFGSVRQFNRVCNTVFRDTPRALRSRRRKRDRLVADGGLSLRLPYLGPLDWQAVLAVLAAQATPGVEHVSGRIYRRTVLVDGDPAVLELGPGEASELRLVAHLPHWDGLVHLVARTRRIASLDLDLDEATRALAADAELRRLLETRPGLRPAGTWDGFETGIRLILADRLAPSAAPAAMRRLVERLGRPVSGLEQLGLSHTFPDPETVAGDKLPGLGLDNGVVGAVHAFAAAVAEGDVRLDGSAPLDRLVDSVAGIDGVGGRVARELALRLGEPDAYPATSIHELGQAERWRPWRAIAATHLAAAMERAA